MFYKINSFHMRKIKACTIFLYVCAGCLFFQFSACTQIDLYEKSMPIPKHEWYSNNSFNAQFLITDTSALYNIFITLRHTDAYTFNNIWLNVGMQAPADTMKYIRFNILLGDDAKGWEGTGMGDIWYVKKKINARPYQFHKVGDYAFKITQIMREDPLMGIMNAGISVEQIPD